MRTNSLWYAACPRPSAGTAAMRALITERSRGRRGPVIDPGYRQRLAIFRCAAIRHWLLKSTIAAKVHARASTQKTRLCRRASWASRIIRTQIDPRTGSRMASSSHGKATKGASEEVGRMETERRLRPAGDARLSGFRFHCCSFPSPESRSVHRRSIVSHH